jgi:hypothetical protein
MFLNEVHKSPDGALMCAHFRSKHGSHVDWDTAVLIHIGGKDFAAIYSAYTAGWYIYNLKTQREEASSLKSDLFEAAFRPHIVGPIRRLPYGVTCEQYFANIGEQASH